MVHYLCNLYMFFFFFKQKTAYEMRISDWSSDVCSSDLLLATRGEQGRFVHEVPDVRTGNAPATARASNVSPVPGAPTRSTPFGAVPPRRVYFSGFLRRRSRCSPAPPPSPAA